MFEIFRRLAVVGLALLLANTAWTQYKGDTEINLLKQWMTGHFSSEAQSKEDSAFLHIELRMQPVWTHRTDGHWLYVEQAAAGSLQQPYRQRIYRLYRQDAQTLVSKVYELPQPLRFAGAWQDTLKLQGLTTDSLLDRQGCAIYLRRNAQGEFEGSTPGNDCLSSLRGASYASSEVRIGAWGMVSWDRGWNAAGKQVWGAVKGGYRFDRINQ